MRRRSRPTVCWAASSLDNSNNRPQVRFEVITVQSDGIQTRDDTIQIQSVLALQFVAEENGELVESNWLLADHEHDGVIRDADSIAYQRGR